jgi:8-oxo-dGTP pyrophosphatase MutT (NUDIX family)
MHIVILWLHTPEGKILLAQRSHSTEAAGLWGPSLSGGIDAEETAIATCVRELSEELQLTIAADRLQPLFVTEFATGGGTNIHAEVLHCTTSAEEISQVVLDPSEVAQIAWKTIPEVRQWQFTSATDFINHEVDGLWEQILTALEQVTTHAAA